MFWPLTSIPIIWGVGNDVKLIWYPKLRPLCVEVKVQTFPMQFSSVLDHTFRLVMFLSRVSVINHSEGISWNFLWNLDESKAPIWPLAQDEVMMFKFSQSEIYTAYIFQGVYFIIVLWADYLERSMHSDSDWIWFGLPEKWVITIGFLSPVIF